MSTHAPVDLLELSPTATIATEDLAAELIAEGFTELTASWQSGSTVGERRREHRYPCNLPALLVPLDSQGLSVASVPLEVRIKDISKSGIGISHPDPMPHRLVLLTFETPEKKQRRLIVRLKWCRFKGTDVYESGGQIVRALKPGESHAADPASDLAAGPGIVLD
jgi:hypothetical protein